MSRFVIVFSVLFLAVAGAGCASGRKSAATTPTTTRRAPSGNSREAVRLTYPAVGVRLTAAPTGYRPAVSRSEVLSLFRKSGHESLAKGERTVRLLTVSGVTSTSAGIVSLPGYRHGYPAWVITFHHTRPTSYGGGSVSQKPDCVFVAIYNLRARVWTWFFQSCPGSLLCGYGCNPANQPSLEAAASVAGRVAGRAYYTGAVVNDPSNTVTVYLAHAPHSILHRLRAIHPGTYVIHNDAPRPLRTVMKLMRSLKPKALKAKGINVVGYSPTQDGYLQVGVTGNVAQAQARLNAIYGPNIIRVNKEGNRA